MAIPVSNSIKRWAALQGRGPIAELYEVDISDTETLYYVLGDPTKTGSVTFPLDPITRQPTAEAKTYTAIAIKREDITQSIRAELPSFRVSISNITGVAGGLIENYDLDGRRVRITRVLLDTLTIDDSFSHDFTIQSQAYDRQVATFVIGYGNLFKRKLPWQKIVKQRCQHPWPGRFQADNPCSFPSDYFEANTEQAFGQESGRSIIVSAPSFPTAPNVRTRWRTPTSISTATGKSGRTLEPIGPDVGEPPVYGEVYVHFFIPPQGGSSAIEAFLARWRAGTAWTTVGLTVNFSGVLTTDMIEIVETPVAQANDKEFFFRYELDDRDLPDLRETTEVLGPDQVRVTRDPIHYFRMPYRLDEGSADFVTNDKINQTAGQSQVIAQGESVSLYGSEDNGVHVRQYGWRTVNGANATVFDVNRTSPGAMHIETDMPVATWTAGARNAPYAFKNLSGDFEVWTRLRPLSPESSGFGGLLCQSRKSGDNNDWVLWGHGFDTEDDERLVAQSARLGVQGITREYITTDRYLKLKRVGDAFTYSSSADGVTWTDHETRNVNLSTNARIGLFVSSSGASNILTAYAFEGFRFLSGGVADCNRLLNSTGGCLGRENQHNFGAYSAVPRR